MIQLEDYLILTHCALNKHMQNQFCWKLFAFGDSDSLFFDEGTSAARLCEFLSLINFCCCFVGVSSSEFFIFYNALQYRIFLVFIHLTYSFSGGSTRALNVLLAIRAPECNRIRLRSATAVSPTSSHRRNNIIILICNTEGKQSWRRT